MKRLLYILLLSGIIFYNQTINAANVTNYITDGFGTPLNTRVIATPFTVSTVFGGTNVLGPSAGFGCTNGFWQISFLGGFYYVDQGLGQPAIVGFCAPGDTNTYGLAQFASQATNPIPSFFASGAGVMYVTNVITTNTFQFLTLYITNVIYASAAATTNNWGGPTNVLDLSFSDQEYSSAIPVAITGVINKGTSTVNTATLSILNKASTNITLTLAATIESRDGLRQYTITNNQDFIISVRYHPADNRTNAVTATQF